MRILVSGNTKQVRRLAEKYPDELGVLLTPNTGNKVGAIPSLPWAGDNAAFSDFDAGTYHDFIDKIAGSSPLWVCVPDVVGDAMRTLHLFDTWQYKLRVAHLPLAFVGQDGIEYLRVPWDQFDCWFIGGTDRWKLTRASYDLAQEARRRGKLVHMGRVNSLRRLRTAHAWGCDSIDGRNMSAFAALVPGRLERYLRFCRSLELEEGAVLFP